MSKKANRDQPTNPERISDSRQIQTDSTACDEGSGRSFGVDTEYMRFCDISEANDMLHVEAHAPHKLLHHHPTPIAERSAMTTLPAAAGGRLPLDIAAAFGKVFLLPVRIMENSRPSVEDVLENSLRELAGERAPEKATTEMVVLESWSLDSLHGMELACDLCVKLAIDIPLEDNPLVIEDATTGKRRSRTFGEVVDYLSTLVTQS